MNLGIDFGSTYSMLSYYDEQEKSLKAAVTEGNSPHIPSIACYASKKSKDLVFGHLARTTLDAKRNLVPYRAFKMLLPVTDKDKLAQMGYTGDNMPQRIAKEFLKSQIQAARRDLHVSAFDQVTICIPYVWDRDYSTLSGKGVLYEICQELIQEEGLMRSVRVISEPAAATACVAHKYTQRTQRLYQGWILIIDYGGGTLDITLSKVSTVRRSGRDFMEISVEGQAGAGEHHSKDNRIGDAGIAYMQAVVAKALEQAGYPDAPRDRDFQKAVDLLESTLINNAAKLEEKVLENGNDPAMLAEDEDVFLEVSYGDEDDEIPITYATLVQVYDDLIRPLLDRELTRIYEEKMRDLLHMDNPRVRPKDLLISLVGGFGQFILVQQQVAEFFNIGDTDDMDSGKEDAISFGAALIANNNISLQVKAPLSMGLWYGKGDFDFAFLRGTPMEPNEIHFLNRPILYLGPSSNPRNSPWKFCMNLDGAPKRCRYRVPLERAREQMMKVEKGCGYKCGFSVNESEIISFWYAKCDTMGKYNKADLKDLPLGNIADIFGSILTDESAPIDTKK